MKKFKLFILGLVVTSFCSISTIAQTEKSPSKNTDKIAIVFPDAFEDEKTGIIDLIVVNQKVKIEFKPQADELLGLFSKIDILEKNIKEQSSRCGWVNCSNLIKMVEDYETLVSETKIKQLKANSAYEKRKSKENTVIKQKMFEVLKQFGKKIGFAAIIDGSKLEGNLTYPDFKDITEEFIKFYNENFSKAKWQ